MSFYLHYYRGMCIMVCVYLINFFDEFMSSCLFNYPGVCAVLVPFLPQFETLAVFCVVVGMIGGVYVSLMVVVIIDFLGLEKLAASFGLATMCMGLATVPVSPILG